MIRTLLAIATIFTQQASANITLTDIGPVRLQWVDADHWAVADGQIAKALRADGRKWIVIRSDADLTDLDQWLLHEFAHHAAWDAHGEDIQEHGIEFRQICRQLVTRNQSKFCGRG